MGIPQKSIDYFQENDGRNYCQCQANLSNVKHPSLLAVPNGDHYLRYKRPLLQCFLHTNSLQFFLTITIH